MKITDNTWLWIRSILFTLAMYGLLFAYVVAYQKRITLATFSESFAFTGGILIGLSFALSGLTYFFNIWDSKLRYRKQLGLLGYYFALAHSLTLLWRFPRYIQEIPQAYLNPEALLGLTAMAIWTFMAIISANWAMRVLGRNWRRALRLGYIAYGLLVIRAYLILGDTWREWLSDPVTLPHPRLLLTCFALAVILLRVLLEVALRRKKKTVAKVTRI